jgi:hypothetical protein
MSNRMISGAMALICVVAILTSTSNGAAAAEPNQKIRVVLTTGGHDFVRKDFFAMWDSFVGIAWREGKLEKSGEAFTTENLKDCDVLVTYDMAQNITDEQKAAFLAFLKRGGGLVALHHSIASWQDWPDYERIVGVKYFLKPATREGKQFPKSGYQHDVDFRVHVADPKHPITEGMNDFDIRDETYSGYLVNPKVHVLLTTDHPKSEKIIGWTREEGKARVAFIELGHDNKAYTNPSYKKIVERAVLWAAGKIGK